MPSTLRLAPIFLRALLPLLLALPCAPQEPEKPVPPVAQPQACEAAPATPAPEPKRPRGGMFILRWLEWPSRRGPSTKATPEDRGRFNKVLAYDPEEGVDAFGKALAKLHEGDLIAYRMGAWEARKGILLGGLNKIGYRILEYGHLAILVEDARQAGQLRIFSSESLKGPNLDEGLETLKKHRWDVYRLDKSDRLDIPRLREFAAIAVKKSGHLLGYDFIGMFGLRNPNLHPEKPGQIRRAYICSTVVAAALHYAKVQTDAVNRGGILDLVSPKQVVSSKCRLLKEAPGLTLEVEELPAPPKGAVPGTE